MRDLIQRRHLDRLWRLVGTAAPACRAQAPCAAMVVRVPSGTACRVPLPAGRWELTALGGGLWATPGDGRDLALRAGDAAVLEAAAWPLALAALDGDAVALLRAAPDP